MSRREATVRLRHMLEHSREAVEMARGKTRGDLDSDRKLNLALVRLLEIVGEAAARMTEPERADYPGMPWDEIVGLRNRLIHGYDSKDLPPLIRNLERTLSGEGKAKT